MLYKYCDTRGFDILKNKRLLIKKVDNFNDPFELLLGIDINTAPSIIQKEYEENPDIINSWRPILDQENIKYDKDSIEDILNKIVKLQISDFEKNVPNVLRNLDMGVVCFSESPDVIQMWAHYTGNHSGIVIGIEESEFIDDKEAIIVVTYRDKMVLFPITMINEKLNQYIKKYVREALGRKETNWNYEKEVRIYATLEKQDIDGNYYKNIPISSIKEIYLGVRSSEITKLLAECIKNREEYNHLKVYEMTINKREYKLDPQEIDFG